MKFYESNINRVSASWCFFFFQAEDGIRDLYVTGVQTCALPISRRADWMYGSRSCVPLMKMKPSFSRTVSPGRPISRLTNVPLALQAASAAALGVLKRSEERRVGKECRSRGAPVHQKKQTPTQQ